MWRTKFGRLAGLERSCQSSYLYRYSGRLSWSPFPNTYSAAVRARRESPAPLIDLTVSNPTAVDLEYPHAAISAAYGSIASFNYNPQPLGTWSAREAISEYHRSHGVIVSPINIALTASTSEAYGLLFKMLCDPGDHVLVPTPSYPLFEYLASSESVRTIPYMLRYDGSWFFDLSELEQAITDTTRAIVLVNPNNPTGSFFKREEAHALVEFAITRGIPLIVDEVFLDYGFGTNQNRCDSFTALSEGLIFCLNGLSKSAGMPQMKLGWITVAGKADEKRSALDALELLLDNYLSVNTPVQIALPRLLQIGEGIRAQLQVRTRNNLQTLNDLLAGTPAHCLHIEGGWSAILRLPGHAPEEVWLDKLLSMGVITQPGYFFDMPRGSFVVVSLITQPDIFATGVSRIREALK